MLEADLLRCPAESDDALAFADDHFAVFALGDAVGKFFAEVAVVLDFDGAADAFGE